MQTATVSDDLAERLSGLNVIAAAFSTYTFDPEFFELEVVPLLLPTNVQYSTDPRVKQIQVREKLRESGLRIEVFFDRKICFQECAASPGMEYLFHGVHAGTSAFHPKVAFILVKDGKEESRLFVGAGSNNLTRAGWWDNIECAHWEELRRDAASQQLVKWFLKDVRWLARMSTGERKLTNGGSGSALLKIEEFLTECRTQDDLTPTVYYAMNRSDSRTDTDSFPKFIARQAQAHLKSRDWTLEIVSPFFANDPRSALHELFLPPNLEVERIHLLLPVDEDEKALCLKEYFEHIEAQERIHWARWRDDVATLLGVGLPSNRRLHAKLYHLCNGRQAWVFVGSVNFSQKAMRDNNEAGFWVRLDTAEPLLEPIHAACAPEFACPSEVCPGNEKTSAATDSLPCISLAYDWREGRLQGICETGASYRINILGAENRPVVEQFTVSETPRSRDGELTEFRKLLEKGSLVNISGINTQNEEPFPVHTVMLLQTGWSHKPLDIPALTPAQILAIYASLSPERRDLMLYRKLVSKFVLSGEPGDLTDSDDVTDFSQFFCEYAEIFHAFRELCTRLNNAQESGDKKRVDYYLTGTGMDSLRTLLNQLRPGNNDKKLDSVTEYLILLSIREIYEANGLAGDRLCEEQLIRVKGRIDLLRNDGSINLEHDRTSAERLKFFDWFEKQFHKQYRLVRGSEA